MVLVAITLLLNGTCTLISGWHHIGMCIRLPTFFLYTRFISGSILLYDIIATLLIYHDHLAYIPLTYREEANNRWFCTIVQLLSEFICGDEVVLLPDPDNWGTRP
jgi:hypothetical protein